MSEEPTVAEIIARMERAWSLLKEKPRLYPEFEDDLRALVASHKAMAKALEDIVDANDEFRAQLQAILARLRL